jgi:hypothetical protein
MGLRPEVDHVSLYRGRCLSLGKKYTTTLAVSEHRSQATHAPRCMSYKRPSKHREQGRSS